MTNIMIMIKCTRGVVGYETESVFIARNAGNDAHDDDVWPPPDSRGDDRVRG